MVALPRRSFQEISFQTNIKKKLCSFIESFDEKRRFTLICAPEGFLCLFVVKSKKGWCRMSRFKVFVMVWLWRFLIALVLFLAFGCQLVLILRLTGPYLAVGTPFYFLSSLFGSLAILAIALWGMMRTLKNQAEGRPLKLERTRRLVSRILGRLCRRTGVRRPTLIIMGDSDQGPSQLRLNAAILELLCSDPVLLVGAELPHKLTQKEIEAVLAHECRHARQFEVATLTVLALLNGLIGLTFLGCSMNFVWLSWGMPGIGFWAGVAQVFWAWLLLQALQIPFALCLAMASRATEFKTDALAALDMGSGEYLISALYKIEEAVRAQLSIPVQKREGLGALLAWIGSWFNSHPSTEERAYMLRWMASAKKARIAAEAALGRVQTA